jgi:hypothetical protein
MYIVVNFGKQMEIKLQKMNRTKDGFKITNCAFKNVEYSSELSDD